ncbi:dihydrolipoamide dehydrogenase [Thermus sp. 2.9]|uniref:dihydrolipoyl dehydrogenase n=1 Tax=Thermus TaxID=270 RepID=UPI0005441B80|nr:MULTISPECIES: dihydrolipoyl dehydrogenase [Thermus]KHG64862.1 dihydrolipoamide dehydrogenase [Thermus sp. 2.9]
MDAYDLIVIGTGPGGYHAAIRGAQLGLKVLAVEAAEVGGVCLNVGCIPTKALLHAAETLHHLKVGEGFGLKAAPELDLKKLGSWRESVVKKLTGGVATLLKGNKVELVRGFARFAGPKEIEVNGERYGAKSVILATGSEPASLPGFPFGEDVWDSTRALRVEEGIPGRLLVIGGGAVGLELGQVYHRLGAQVTLIEYMPEILPAGDPETAALLRRALEKEGIRVRTGTKAVGYEKKKDGLHVRLEAAQGGGGEEIVVDKILVAVGRKPRTEGLNLEKAGVALDAKGFVQVNARMETTAPGVYAIGDVARPPLLAHKAMKEGLVAAENAAGKDAAFDYQIPSVVYTSPEWAGVGLTEEEAKRAGYRVRVGKFPFSASGRALTLGATEGLIKVVGDEETDLLLGVFIVGPQAGELIAEATLALEMAATVSDLALTVHAHPTLSEGLMEAAEAFHKEAIHILNR